MLSWLAANWGTLAVGAVVLALVGSILLCQVRKRRKGGGCSCGCSGGCSGCSGCCK